VVLVALAAIAILTIIVISAWKASGGPSTATTTSSTTAAKPPHVVPPLFEVTALRGSTHLIVHRNGATGLIAFDGTITKGDPARAIHGSKLWVSISTPENLRILVRGRVARIPGAKPQVIVVSKTGWRPA
jgi:hypothetical protein